MALPTAVECARLFVSSTLRHWRAVFIEPDALVLVAELVAHAVKTTGPSDNAKWTPLDYPRPITVRLVGFEKHIVIEIETEDGVADKAVLPEPCTGQDEPRDLQLVAAIARRWGSRPTPRGRVMWAELPVYEQTKSGLPIRTRQPRPHPRPPAAEV